MSLVEKTQTKAAENVTDYAIVDMMVDGTNHPLPDENNTTGRNSPEKARLGGQYKRWLQLALYSMMVVAGQSAATLLGRLYFNQGGNSKWLSTLVQTAGFPILIPILFATRNKNQIQTLDEQIKPPSLFVLGSVYLVFGILSAAVCLFFSIGLFYLPVSTFALLSGTQLAFNAVLAYFLNAQKFTPYIINSVILLTTSSALLVVQTDSLGDTKVSKGRYAVGVICTLCASAGYSLTLSLSQIVFTKVVKQTVKELLKFIIYESLIASCIILISLFASGEWLTLKAEVKGYQLGKASYMLTLIWIALCWQIFSIGMLGLIVKASALFANVISTLCLPVVPVLAVVMFRDKMSGLKAVSMFLAIWGFISYIYQHYLDDLKSKTESKKDCQVPEISLV